MRGLVVVLVATLAATLVPAMSAGAETSLPVTCARPVAVAERYATDVSTLTVDGRITFGGERIAVDGPDADFLRHDPRRIAWSQWLRSWAWLAEVARSVDPILAVDIAVAWHEAVPDPGGAAPLETLRARGWTEAIVTPRMTLITCLWSITGDDRLRPLMEALVAANLDPARYYGRPRFAPHNHGAMANFALISAADAFDRVEWARAAVRRFAVDFPEAYAACGADREQSSAYLIHNRRLWLRAADAVAEHGDRGLAERIERRIAALDAGLRVLTLPDGTLPVIGDGSPTAGLAPTGEGDPQWWCPERGWAAGRDAWSGTRVHYTARFGPAMTAHGHDDHGSLTWWAEGVPVLVDRGNPAKDTDPAKQAWADSKFAHNTFAARGRDYRASSTATRRLARDQVTITTSEDARGQGITRERTAVIDLRAPRLVVTDTGTSLSRVMWAQTWHLDPQWGRVSVAGTVATARHPGGQVLTLSCERIDGAPAVMRVLDVPHYGARGARVGARAVVCEARGREATLRTVLAVEAMSRGASTPVSP